MTHEEMIAVIMAHKEGKQIQYRVNGFEGWNDCSSKPHWDFAGHDYRIKPIEPKKVKLEASINKNGLWLSHFVEGNTPDGYIRIPELDKVITLLEGVEL